MKNLTTQIVTLLVFFSFAILATADDPTSKEKRQVKTIASTIDRAGRLFKSKKYESSAEKIEQAIAQLFQMAANADADLMKLIAPEYERLSKAHKLLTDQGQNMTKLADLPAPMVEGESTISFVKDVAPIFIAKCGRCHVRGNRGNFSAANYDALMNSTMVTTGLPADSRIVQVIEDEEMPPGGNVEENDLATLKAWIRQGAKFDGQNSGQGLNMLTGNQPDRQRPRQMEIAKPTGNETVSFGLHVAPILVSACAECHIDTNNVRGNFSMADFTRFLAGGDSGTPIEANNSRNSNLIKRLRGVDSDVMPPSGKLDDAIINRIATWIDEGAKFDAGENAGLPLRTVAAISKAASQSHLELSDDRAKLAQKTWKLVMSDIKNETVSTDNFRVVGATLKPRLEELGKIVEQIAIKVQSALRVKSDDPFIKGNTTIFVFERRYDFNELGVMLNGREIPKHVKGRWDYTTIDSFASVLLTRNKSPEAATAVLAQQIAAIRVSNMAPDVPRWFADGVGYWAAAKAFPKDEEVGKWEEQALAAANSMQSPSDFATGKMPQELAALASYVFVKQLRSDTSKFSKLFRFMNEGFSFERASTEALGQPPIEFFKIDTNRRRRQR